MNTHKWLLALALLLLPRAVLAAAPNDCNNPRNATDSVFAWLQPERHDPKKAARCLDPEGRGIEERAAVAQRIKKIYDARALHVKMDAISEKPEFSDPKSGAHRVVPHEELPQVVVERQADGQWRWTRASLDHIDKLYADSFSEMEQGFVSKLPEWLRVKLFGVSYWQYLAILLIFSVGLVVRKVIQYIVTQRVRNLVENLGQKWASSLVDVFASPGATLIMAVVLRVAYPQLGLPIHAALALSITVRLLVVFAIVWAAYRVVDVIAERMAERAARTDSKLDDQLVPLVRKTLKIITIIAGGLFILQNLSVNVGSLLAGLGIGGVAVALAAKDTVANFFGSIMIFIDRPFQIGDWVALGKMEGIVEEVGFRSTRIRTFYNSVVTVPNAKFMEANIDNYGERKYRRCFFTLNLTYDTTPEQMQSFVEGVRAIIRANPATWKESYEVHMSAYGAHSLDVMVYFFFQVDTWSDELNQRHNVMLEILRLAEDLKVRFAYPTQTLHLDKVAQPGDPLALPTPPEDAALARMVEAFGPGGERARPSGPKITHGFLPGVRPAISSEEGGEGARA